MDVRAFIHACFDMLVPPSERERRVAALDAQALTALVQPTRAHRDADLVLFSYKNAAVRDVVWTLKYQGNRRAAELLGDALFAVLFDELAERALWGLPERPLLVPMPLSRARERERGFNQCTRVAERLAALDEGRSFTYAPNVLRRSKHTERQTRLGSRAKREENLKNAFAVKDASALGGRVILLDDVITTGATMRAAKHALRAAGAREVICVALARA